MPLLAMDCLCKVRPTGPRSFLLVVQEGTGEQVGVLPCKSTAMHPLYGKLVVNQDGRMLLAKGADS